MNNKVGVITSPHPQGVPIFARYFLGGILDVRGYRLRTLGPRLPLNSSLDVNAPPIPNGANIGGNLQYYSNLELEFPIIDKVGIRGVTFFDAGNTWNLEQQFCKTTPAPQFSQLVSPCFDCGQPREPPLVDGLRHPLVLAARPAPLRVGLPAQQAELRRVERLRVHHRQLLLGGCRPSPFARASPRGAYPCY